MEDIRSILGLYDIIPTTQSYESVPVNAPDTFDANEKWPSWKIAIKNQGQCGSCWAHALA